MRCIVLLVLSLVALVAGMGAPGSDQPCWDRTKELERRASRNGGQLPPGGEYPECDLLGRFGPKQCTGSQCYCVDPDGNELFGSRGQYTKNRWEADGMECRCAREEHEQNQQPPLPGAPRVRCNEIGNYHHTQCVGSVCHCVDPITGQKNPHTNAEIADASIEQTCAKLAS